MVAKLEESSSLPFRNVDPTDKLRICRSLILVIRVGRHVYDEKENPSRSLFGIHG